MTVENYKKTCDEVISLYRTAQLYNCIRAIDMIHNLMEIYVQDGALPGIEEFYGQTMVTKAQLIMTTLLIIRAKEPTNPSPDSPSSASSNL